MTKKDDNPLKKYEKEYEPEMWREYSMEELMWWVLNLTRRATHRTNLKKALKDTEDAKNYLWMMQELIKEEMKE
jgi:hypothetical protein